MINKARNLEEKILSMIREGRVKTKKDKLQITQTVYKLFAGFAIIHTATASIEEQRFALSIAYTIWAYGFYPGDIIEPKPIFGWEKIYDAWKVFQPNIYQAMSTSERFSLRSKKPSGCSRFPDKSYWKKWKKE